MLGNIAGVILALIVGSVLLILTAFTEITIAVAIGVAVLIYAIGLVVGIVCAFLDPFEMDD
ncbi:hypothetical protein A3K29_01260 [Candidatus Collierbacteria bacterium RIFOXYB2_FULL_46_14]|nr:MAG: hypothetical protein A3K29_01260 [Candidatus Collierbacteria bacterium RIFOXYB2_FULL_46_14]OGD75801.1 MAG: hypothetical protein A3K43_01260 [Candidatus Collierbacteria bacterium RIFOXYA2_FULL_46_20]OGD77137.1 MAG: hypothetical protein A3K39_01260 [Candidatus Collierbacteria bacterium RIFOXYC2_FULL_43_15]OGD80427.1 MAG: hypothetical protein A2320_01750 [Pseudomonadales bacterium GWC2_63_15]OGD81859.1 MAG: hypothetical protein A3K36_01260 [Candidatus Collierbacteria bacterium RIFOXYD2_FUL